MPDPLIAPIDEIIAECERIRAADTASIPTIAAVETVLAYARAARAALVEADAATARVRREVIEAFGTRHLWVVPPE
jgi:phosphoribosylpyrophosphate synthetase